MRLGAILSVAAAGAALTVAVAQASLSKALSQAAPGFWEMSGVPSAKAPVRQCVGDLLTLAKFEHRGQNCTPKIIRDLKTYKESMREQSLRAFPHRAEGLLPGDAAVQARHVGETLVRRGWKVRLQEREGRYLIYRASFTRMNELLGFLTANCCQGDVCLEPSQASCKC